MKMAGRGLYPLRCVRCNKFRRAEDLDSHFEPDTAFTAEDCWFECKVGKGCRVNDEPDVPFHEYLTQLETRLAGAKG